jgi:hypothetical protein
MPEGCFRREAAQRRGVGAESFSAQDADSLAALDIWKANIHDNEIYQFSPHDLNTIGRVSRHNGIEFLMQRQLLFQRLAQFGVIVDDEDLVCLRHFPRAPAKV